MIDSYNDFVALYGRPTPPRWGPPTGPDEKVYVSRVTPPAPMYKPIHGGYPNA